MEISQYLRWRKKTIEGKGNKYYPKDLLEILKKPLKSMDALDILKESYERRTAKNSDRSTF